MINSFYQKDLINSNFCLIFSIIMRFGNVFDLLLIFNNREMIKIFSYRILNRKNWYFPQNMPNQKFEKMRWLIVKQLFGFNSRYKQDFYVQNCGRRELFTESPKLIFGFHFWPSKVKIRKSGVINCLYWCSVAWHGKTK